MLPEDIQTLIYSTGKENGYSENLRDWFKLIYEVVFGDENGPRMGFFISFFGVNETKALINAFKNIKPSDKDLQDFVKKGKERIDDPSSRHEADLFKALFKCFIF